MRFRGRFLVHLYGICRRCLAIKVSQVRFNPIYIFRWFYRRTQEHEGRLLDCCVSANRPNGGSGVVRREVIVCVSPANRFGENLSIVPRPSAVRSTRGIRQPHVATRATIDSRLRPFYLRSICRVPCLNVFSDARNRRTSLFISVLLANFSRYDKRGGDANGICFRQEGCIFRAFCIFGVSYCCHTSLLARRRPELVDRDNESSSLTSVPGTFPAAQIDNREMSYQGICGGTSRRQSYPKIAPSSLLVTRDEGTSTGRSTSGCGGGGSSVYIRRSAFFGRDLHPNGVGTLSNQGETFVSARRGLNFRSGMVKLVTSLCSNRVTSQDDQAVGVSKIALRSLIRVILVDVRRVLRAYARLRIRQLVGFRVVNRLSSRVRRVTHVRHRVLIGVANRILRRRQSNMHPQRKW